MNIKTTFEIWSETTKYDNNKTAYENFMGALEIIDEEKCKKWVAVDDLHNIKELLKDTLTDYELWINSNGIQEGSAWERRYNCIKNFIFQLEKQLEGEK